MGSATAHARAAALRARAALRGAPDLTTGERLLDAARVIGRSAQLRSALADPSADAADKRAVIGRLFPTLAADARSLLEVIVAERWSGEDDLLAGIEEIGIRLIAASAPRGTVIEDELFAFGRAVSSNAQLELAIGSKLGSPAAKSALVSKLFDGKASAQTIAILSHLVQQPRGRRTGELVAAAARIVADESGKAVATVTVAAPLAERELTRLATVLATQVGREIRINQLVDPGILGGVRVQIGDEVIDGSVATRLSDLRHQLVG